jgi:glucose/arabinose dehydrogenase/uncharacterized cupredoxin-like copper-binding protein
LSVLASRLPTALVLALGLVASMLVQGSALRMQDATPAALPADTGPAHLGGDLPGDPHIQLIQVATGLSAPVNVSFPPDDSGRMFVVEQTGLIRIVNPDGTVNPDPFLDLSNAISLRPGQQGLLGLVFHPDFANNGKFYVDYNNLYGNGEITVSEFLVDPKNPNKGSLKTERPLLTIDKPYPQHNGGTLRFGPDGYLYISTGDGGWQGDPEDNAQSRFSLLGKILRIDVDGGATGQPYGIPADNPFAGPGRYDSPYPGQPPATATPEGGKAKKARTRNDPGVVSPENRKNRPKVRQEIWALGFRNPWQFSFDPKTGDFYVGDVGADTWEEINFQPAGETAGQNYGWDWLEASHCYPAEIGEDCPRQQVGVLPVAEYQHGADGCAVIGLGVYRGEAFPSLDGIYFSGEYCTGEIRGLQRDAQGIWQFQNLLDTALQITGSGQDASGDLYVTAVTGEPAKAGQGADSVWKLVAADKVPEGAVTVPLGQPRAGDVAVDEYGAPVDAATGEAPAEAPATPAAAAPATAGATSAQDVVVDMYDMYFEPNRITIPANTDVRFVFTNRGQSSHNFSVNKQDISVDVEPGGTGETIVNLPPGTYKFICNVPGHKQVGMNGSLIVK